MVQTFPKCISLRVNVIMWLEFELVYYDAAIWHISHYATGTSPCLIIVIFIDL